MSLYVGNDNSKQEKETVMTKKPFHIKLLSMARLPAAALISTLLLFGCSGGGGGQTVEKQAAATFTNGLLKLGVAGSATDLIAGIDLLVNLPAGMSVDADPTSGEPAAGVVTISGAPAGGSSSLVVAKYAPAVAGAPATLHIGVLNAAGLHPGEFATVRFNLAAGTTLPALNAFTMASFSAKGPDGSALSGISAAPLSVAGVDKAAATKQVHSQVVFNGGLNSQFMNIVAETPTRNSSQTITGTCMWGDKYVLTITPANAAVKVENQVVNPDGSWSAQISGLVEGKNVITVIDTEAGAYVGSVSATIIVDTKAPDLSFASPTYRSKNSITSIGGGVGDPLNPDVASLTVNCDSATVEMATFAVPYWSAIISNLSYGDNTCHVTAYDLAGNEDSKDVLIHYDNLAPDLDIHFNALAKYGVVQPISGTVESGITPVMTVNGSAYTGTMTVSGTTWSCTVSGLAEGANIITVTATDTAGNVTTSTATITAVTAKGSFSGLSQPTVTDALKALRIAVGFDQPTTAELLYGDLFDDGKIDLSDAILILEKTVGL
jgi:hypothetical protein